MNWLFRLLGWDNPRMTRLGLTKLAGGICLAFVALASAWSQTHPYHNIHRRALVAYVKQGPAAGERFLHGYLIQHPEDRKAWLMLVRHRQRPAAKGRPKFSAAGRVKASSPALTASSVRPGWTLVQ